MASEKKASPFAGLPFTPGKIYEVKKEELSKIVPDITMDPDTVNKQLTLSEGNKKATYGAWQTYPPRPERFETYLQVLAKEALQGIHYWEVDWSYSPDESVYVGVAYGSTDRKGPSSEFGNNTVSWVFGQYAEPAWSDPVLRAWHNGLVWQSDPVSGGCTRVGVLLDWHGGTLSFTKISGNQRVALYRFDTTFTEPVFPCFWAGKSGNYVALRPVS
ncbi:stonustoxin subunit alpha-like [Acanthopagrus latus]|uniref:stonustoxin subunit alpha-like n=1 Tax=Acanthopagrus latus TaxID=8177 RepID=UPI00187BDA04|nr:stonustoxin subunit alpha-like [Acanthopagrus latus]XP_036938330.1 stonustoxin subunit alpha-like [Acanthopagrus latus]